ncbi:TOB3 (member of AAA-ATPase family) [Fusarium albosuccineum]|uniref:TOB3 (Member of AAA-ATPase family) n=1 Tax=Fusarium albosuccineum TaxID=1237068 RepID=A0A8H4PCW6_9HYPO|nr:TOB3 (member of AAA-ATPase family) [Fusarium albosuccineum]
MDASPLQELRVVEGDDASSVVSFEDISHRVVRARKPQPRGVLKVDGKVPDVLHVVKYIGWNDKVVDYRQSTQAFKDIPEFEGDGDEDDDDDTPKEKPVLEIVTKVFTEKASSARRSRRRPRAPPGQEDRPITETFDQVNYRYDDYYSDDDPDLEAYAPDIARPFMTIHSEHLINALKAVVAYYPYINLEGKFVTIGSPYRVLYHHRRELAQYRDNQPSTHDSEYTVTTAKHIDALLKFLDDNLGDQIRQEEERHKLKIPRATFEFFWLLLKPGEVVYTKRYDIWTPYVISSINVNQNAYSSYDVYKINCWMLETNGTKVNRFMYSFSLSPWLGEQAIGSLPIIPAQFWPEDLDVQGGTTMREKQIALGKLYWELLKRPTYMDYEGLLVNSGSGNRQSRGPTGFMRGRVICDAAGFDSFYFLGPDSMRGMARCHRPPQWDQVAPPPKDHLPRNKPRCGCQACLADRSSQKDNSPYVGFEDLDPNKDSPPDSDLFYLVCSNTIPGFILGDRRWGHLNVASLRQLETDKEAFKYLVLDDEVKMTVKALIGKFATDLGEGRVSPWGNDFVKNKGEGRIFLLHGAPGVGKTCTAECVAELTNRPLIALTSGDLSVDTFNLETNLSYFLELGKRYGALVLLDEADVYLERRRSKDIARNGLVSIFLRALEYYRGVLFLTTNRVQSFDSAFLSRIHVALHYKSLKNEDRERIWTQNFDRLSRDSNDLIHVSVAAREFVWKSREVRSLKWNGREIRNAMQTALALAESDAQDENTERITISEKHLRAVVKMSRGFRDYIKNAVPVEGFEDTINDADDSDDESE